MECKKLIQSGGGQSPKQLRNFFFQILPAREIKEQSVTNPLYYTSSTQNLYFNLKFN